jgi:hypothetical protein
MEVKKTGGARVGMFNATWPFATLKVNSSKLELSTGFMGNFVFRSEDISSIEPYGLIPFLGRGIKINHHVKTYNQKIIFWTFGSPHSLIEEIHETTFFDKKKSTIESSPSETKEQQTSNGLPIKTPIAIAIVIIWNVLLLGDFIIFFKEGTTGSPLGYGTVLATGMIFTITFLLLSSKWARKLILKEGYQIYGLKRSLYFIMVISGILCLSSF